MPARQGFGLRSSWRDRDPAKHARTLLLICLPLANVAGIVAYTLEHPFCSSMKATYLLLSLPTYAVCTALGLAWWERWRIPKCIAVATLVLLFTITVVHVVQIVHGLDANAKGFFPDGPVPQPRPGVTRL